MTRYRDHLGPTNKLELFLAPLTGYPTTLEELVDFSQIAQAEGLKLAVEHYRRSRPQCSGTLIWQLDDCWPGMSWSLVDYDTRPKGAYHYARRFNAALLACFLPTTSGDVELWLCNDSGREAADDLTVRLSSFGGETLWEKSLAAAIPAQSSALLETVAAADVQAGPDRYLTVSSAAGTFGKNRWFFSPIKDLQRPAAVVDHSAEVQGSTTRVTLTAHSYALFVHVTAANPRARFDDNFFDMEAGETRVVTVMEDPGEVTVRSL